ncbi:Putative receptor protein kinase ZmPK1 [Linum grandiflorum]
MELSKMSSFLLLLLLLSSISQTSAKDTNKLFSLSPNSGRNLVSPNRVFSAGFVPVGDNAFTFSVWYEDGTVVWSANRDYPVNGRYSELVLLSSGNLILTDAGRTSVVWESRTASSWSSNLLLLDSGNLVVQDSNRTILWQSFNFPTDTLLPNQPLTKENRLVSSRSRTNRSSGYFSLYFDNDNVLRLLYADSHVSSVYWPDPELMSWEAQRSTYNSSRIAILDSSGGFSSTDEYGFKSSDYGLERIQRRIVLDFDGNVRLYSRTVERERDFGPWKIAYEAMPQSCRIHGSCGPNSVCNYVAGFGRKCSCIPGYRSVDETDWSLGCIREFNLPCNKSDGIEFIKLANVEFYGYDFVFHPNYTLEQCKDVCLKRCDCLGFQFKFIKHNYPSNMPYCFAKTMLLNGRHSPDFQGDLYLKVAKGVNSSYEPLKSFELKCPAGIVKEEKLERKYTKGKENETLKFVLWFAVAFGGIEFVCIGLVWYYLSSRSRGGYDQIRDSGEVGSLFGFRKFTYAELKKATRGFKDEIGRGGGGTVYRGTLSNKRVAAIKKLNWTTTTDQSGEEEFRAEVSTVGKLNHKNLTEMWGFCSEGKHRMLVYEYMERGSLSENMMSGSLDWGKRFGIAVGAARGLAYLHEECLEWVLHCDVKPGNILLDGEYNAKVSDFGLSREVKRGDEGKKERKARGTRGYMAPEWVLNETITAKVDVYGYGIVVLEMVTGRSPVGVVEWVREKVKEEEEEWLEKVVDKKLGGKYERAEAKVAVKIALRCVEEDKDSRPTMRQVVELLLHTQ